MTQQTKKPMPEGASAEAAQVVTPSAAPVVTPTPTPRDLPVRMQPLVDPITAFRATAKASPGDVVGAEPGFEYTYITPGDHPTPHELAARRQALVDAGWVPRSGPLYSGPVNPEYVPRAGAVEIWRRPQKYADAEWLAELVERVLDPLWSALYWSRRRWLPPAVDAALSFFHGFATPPAGVPRPTAEQLSDLVWEHVRPHPGAQKTPKYPWVKKEK